jgi:hypothetical protein
LPLFHLPLGPLFIQNLIYSNEYYAEENRLLSTAYDDLTSKKEKGKFEGFYLKFYFKMREEKNVDKRN